MRRSTWHKQAVLQALAKLSQTRRRRAFKAWRQATLRRRHNRVVLQGALTRITNQRLAGAFARWRDYSASQRAKVSAFQQCLSKKTLFAALTAWLEGVRHRVVMRACLQTAIERLVRRQLLAAWASWRAAVELIKDKRVNQQRSLAYHVTSSQSRALAAWRSQMQSRVHKQQEMAKAMVHFTRGPLHQALAGWQVYCIRTQQKREAVNRVTAVLRRSRLAKGLKAFKLYVQLSHDHSDKEAKAEAKYKKQLVKTSFGMWQQYTVHSKELQFKVATAVAAVNLRRVTSVFFAWRTAAIVRKKHRQKVEKAAAVRCKREGRSVLLEWQRIAHRQRYKAVLQQSATRLHSQRALHRALAGWQDYCNRGDQKRKTVIRAAIVLRRSRLARGLRAFKLHVQLSRDHSDKLAMADAKYRKQLVRTAAKVWKQYAVHSKELQLKVATAVAAVHLRRVNSVFFAWRTAATVRKEQRLKIEKATAFRCKREGRSVMLGWQRTVHRRRRHKAVLQQSTTRLHLRCLRQVMQEWQFQTWKAIAVRRVAQFVQTHSLRPAFNTWKACHRLELAMAKAKHTSTRRALAGWKEFVALRKAKLGVTQKAIETPSEAEAFRQAAHQGTSVLTPAVLTARAQQARNMGLAFSNIMALLLRERIITHGLLHECLGQLLAHPPITARIEAAAALLYRTKPHLRAACQRTMPGYSSIAPLGFVPVTRRLLLASWSVSYIISATSVDKADSAGLVLCYPQENVVAPWLACNPGEVADHQAVPVPPGQHSTVTAHLSPAPPLRAVNTTPACNPTNRSMTLTPIKSSPPSVTPGQLIKAGAAGAVLPSAAAPEPSRDAASARAASWPAATLPKPLRLDPNPATAVDTAGTADRLLSSTDSGSSLSGIVHASGKTSPSGSRHLHSNSSSRTSRTCADDSCNIEICLHHSSSKHVGALTTAASSSSTEPPQSKLTPVPQEVKTEGRALHSSPALDDRHNKATEDLYSGLQTLLRTHQSAVFLQTVQELVQGRQWQPAQVLNMALHQIWAILHNETWLPVPDSTPSQSSHGGADLPAATLHQRQGSCQPQGRTHSAGPHVSPAANTTHEAATSGAAGSSPPGGPALHTSHLGKETELLLRGVIVKMCSGEDCSFAHDAVITAVRSFLHYALPWENQEAPDDMDPALAWAGRMLGDLVAHNILSGKQAKAMISSAAAIAAKSGSDVKCMPVNEIRMRLGHAFKAGIQDQQHNMQQLTR
ncbi:hypothetical protein ABBQ38_008114 [Trebouxia sp. C0009 RCD-2024]